LRSILIVEDEPNLGLSIKEGLIEYGFDAIYVSSVEDALNLLSNKHFDLVLSDIVMPEKSGVDFLSSVRSKGNNTPFVFLTALGSTDDKVNGLELGADDYLVKPFEFRELIARIKSVLKRIPENQILETDDLIADLKSMHITFKGEELRLTRKEFDLLVYLMRHRGKTVSKKVLLEEVWGLTFDTGTNTIEVYINYVRKKLGNADASGIIETVHGLGYRLNN
jgi:two-component system copper resistance phosphate regulon response regulator CusR